MPMPPLFVFLSLAGIRAEGARGLCLCFAFAVGFFRSQTLGLIPSLSLSLRRELDGGGLGPIATVFLCESTVLLS